MGVVSNRRRMDRTSPNEGTRILFRARSLATALSALSFATVIACSGDDGKPTGPIIVVSNDAAATPPADASATKKKLAESCTGDAECESNVCFLDAKGGWCSLTCTAANAAQVCAPPAFNGICNNKGYCRRPT